MDSGYFFELRSGSNLINNDILFSYTGIKANKGVGYPIFICFKGENVDVYFNGEISRIGYDNNSEFVENKLFSLNLHKGNESVVSMNASLVDLFKMKFPIIPEIEINGRELQRHSVKNHSTYAELGVFPKQQDCGRLFSLSSIFRNFLRKKKVKENQETEKSQENKQVKLSYKTLFLDFLFDVYHSDVFENSPSFVKIKEHLDEIPFIQGIKRKAEFYYQCQYFGKQENQLETFNINNSLFINNLIKSERDWLDILQEQNNNMFINPDNLWFDDVETEVKEVFKKRLKRRNFKDDKQKLDGRWNSYKEFIIKQKNESTKWFVNRNSIFGAWSIFHWLRYVGLTLIFLAVSMVFDIVLLIEKKTIFHHNPNLSHIFSLLPYFLVIIVSLFIAFLIFFVIFKQDGNGKFQIWGYHISSALELFIIPFIVLILSSAFLIFELTSLCNKYILFDIIPYKLGFGMSFIYILLSLVVFFVLVSIFHTKIKTIKNWKLKKCKKAEIFNKIILLVVFFLLLVFIYWSLINIFSSKSDAIYRSFSLVIDFLLFVFAILIVDERKKHPNLQLGTSLRKVISLLFIGLVISFYSNLIIINYSYKDFLDKYNLIDEIWKGADNHPKENFYRGLMLYTSKVKRIKDIDQLLAEKESAKVDAEKEDLFYSSLENIEIKTKDGKELYPVLKTLNINGIDIVTLPSVLFINTLLSLLLAVLVQVVLNRRKFLEGGKT